VRRFAAVLIVALVLAATQAFAADRSISLEVRCAGYLLAEMEHARMLAKDTSRGEKYRTEVLAQAKEFEQMMNFALNKAAARGEKDIETKVEAIAMGYARETPQKRATDIESCLPLFSR
jgi:hypothetical protein